MQQSSPLGASNARFIRALGVCVTTSPSAKMGGDRSWWFAGGEEWERGRLVNATGRRSVTSNHIAPYPRKIKRKERREGNGSKLNGLDGGTGTKLCSGDRGRRMRINRTVCPSATVLALVPPSRFSTTKRYGSFVFCLLSHCLIAREWKLN